MKRYSRSYLIRHPERRGKDVETTRRSCEKFRAHPTTIVNFVEGSRFTEEKRQQTRSPYQNLLPPKAAGIAMALNVLGEQFDKLLNVTLCYPENDRTPFYDMLSGRLTRIVVRVDLVPVNTELHGDYVNDKTSNVVSSFGLIHSGKKDEQIAKIKSSYKTPVSDRRFSLWLLLFSTGISRYQRTVVRRYPCWSCPYHAYSRYLPLTYIAGTPCNWKSAAAFSCCATRDFTTKLFGQRRSLHLSHRHLRTLYGYLP